MLEAGLKPLLQDVSKWGLPNLSSTATCEIWGNPQCYSQCIVATGHWDMYCLILMKFDMQVHYGSLQPVWRSKLEFKVETASNQYYGNCKGSV